MRTIIPVVEINKIAKAPFKILERKEVDGNITKYELGVINRIVAHIKPKNIFEIGTFDGRTTLNMAANTGDARIYTLDLPKNKKIKTRLRINKRDPQGWSDLKYIKYSLTGSRFFKKRESKKIFQLYGDSAAFNFSKYANKIDFGFIDGSHSANYAKNDTKKMLEMLQPKGVIMWHDYGVWDEVTGVLNSFYLTDKRFQNAFHIKNTSFVYLKVG